MIIRNKYIFNVDRKIFNSGLRKTPKLFIFLKLNFHLDFFPLPLSDLFLSLTQWTDYEYKLDSQNIENKQTNNLRIMFSSLFMY